MPENLRMGDVAYHQPTGRLALVLELHDISVIVHVEKDDRRHGYVKRVLRSELEYVSGATRESRKRAALFLGAEDREPVDEVGEPSDGDVAQVLIDEAGL